MARLLRNPIHSIHSIHQIIAGYKRGYICFSKLIDMVARVERIEIVDRVDRKARNTTDCKVYRISTRLKMVDMRWIGWIGA